MGSDLMYRATDEATWDAWVAIVSLTYDDCPNGCYIDEIGPVVVTPAVIGPDGTIITPAVMEKLLKACFYDTLFYLQDIGLIVETPSQNALVPAFIPALDINHITVSYLFEKIEQYGSEDFVIDTNVKFRKEWETILEIKELSDSENGDKLLKNL